MDEQGPTISGIVLKRPLKPIFIDPCKNCIVQSCCTVICQDRIGFFLTGVWEKYDQEQKDGK